MPSPKNENRKPIQIESASTELATSKDNNKLYRSRSEDSQGRISDMVAEKMLLLDAITQRGKTDLKSLDEVQAVSLAYMESCRRSDTLPTFEGLCVAFGYSRQYIYTLLKSRGATDSVVSYLEQLRTMFADLMTTASLKRYVDNATSIFSLKNMTGLGYSDKGDAVPEVPSKDVDSDHDGDYYKARYGDLLDD